ncbi:hypothetical protein [Synechococcus sp. M16CYN]|uniref:hypothetical protein n=1 Tax=Synechococcus sp. M16CYN TaxID=3103139 RepID=UPI00324C9923
MSKKKSRKTAGKGFGKPQKPHKLIRQNGLLLMDRKTLLESLRFVKEKEQDGFDIADAEKVSEDKFHQKILKLSSMGHVRHNREAVPVSVFHNPETDKALYCPLTRDEFSLVHGMRTMDEDGNIIESVDAPKVQYAYTQGNTFYFDLEKLDELEEMLPYNEPTLDELIYLGQMDERFTPLSKEEYDNHLGFIIHSCGRDWDKFSRMYRTKDAGDGLIHIATEVQIGTGGEEFYQPQKTRHAWSKNVYSVPLYFEESGQVSVPPYALVGSIESAV